MNIKEFRKLGYLQEVNRKFFHPLGLALEVIIDDETKKESLGGIWDYRSDPEGMFSGFWDELHKKRARNIEKLRKRKILHRIKNKHGIVCNSEGIQISGFLKKE